MNAQEIFNKTYEHIRDEIYQPYIEESSYIHLPKDVKKSLPIPFPEDDAK